MPQLRKRHRGAKSRPTNGIRHRDEGTPPTRDLNVRQQERSLVKRQDEGSLQPGKFTSRREMGTVLTDLLAQCSASNAAAALIPWFCDALPSPKSRRDYFADLQRFLAHMVELGVHPYSVTGEHVRLYKEALMQSGKRPASIARALSVIRGTYEQLGKKSLVPWDVVGDIQAVSAPRVTKNTTPMIGEDDACRMLHAPDTNSAIGCRDHALLFTYFKTACRSSAIANARVGDLETSDTEWFLRVTEKGSNERRLPLLEAAPSVLEWLDRGGIARSDIDAPLFPAFTADKRSPTRRPLSGRQILNIVKKYARLAGLNVDPTNRRGICTHSLRKTSAVNALRHGAQVHQVQHWLGHADLRTTQEYITYSDDDAEEAARRCQIR